jgi:hypothetical protein
MNSFRFAMYSVVALALLAVFFLYFLPLFFPVEDPGDAIDRELANSEMDLGKYYSTSLAFSSETIFVANSFDTESRSVAFECNNPSICCNLGEECGRIVWDERRIVFKSSTGPIKTSFRCGYENYLFYCKVFFGDAPAQIEIVELNAREHFDLDEGKPEVFLKIRNSGNQPMLFGSTKIMLYKKVWESDQWKRIFLGTTGVEEIGELLPGQEIEKTLEFDVSEIGNFDATVNVLGESAGFEEREISFTAEGTSTLCVAVDCEQPQMQFGECIAVCHCEGCRLGVNCEERLKASITGFVVGATPKEVDLSDKESEILGSNTVQFRVPGYCGFI